MHADDKAPVCMHLINKVETHWPDCEQLQCTMVVYSCAFWIPWFADFDH